MPETVQKMPETDVQESKESETSQVWEKIVVSLPKSLFRWKAVKRHRLQNFRTPFSTEKIVVSLPKNLFRCKAVKRPRLQNFRTPFSTEIIALNT